jgi:hypothetical protein
MADNYTEINNQIDSDYEPQRVMRKIEFKAPVVKKKSPNSERAYWVDLTARELNKPFNQILGITRDWRLEWLKEMYAVCKQSDNFSRLWWGLRKKTLINNHIVK